MTKPRKLTTRQYVGLVRDLIQGWLNYHLSSRTVKNSTSLNWLTLSPSVRHSLPLNKTPNIITIYIVFTVFRMLNYFPVKGEISAILSTDTIMSGEKIHYKQHLGLKIGQYYQVNEHENPSNSQVTWTKGNICLVPSRNEQG